MEQVPAAMDRHLDVIQCHKDGGILLGASSLTGRYWLGSLWFYNNPENAPDVEKCTGGVQLEAGLSDAKWVEACRVFVGLDTGGVAMWQLEDNFSTFVHQHSATDHDNLVNSVSVSSDKKSAVSGSRDCCVKVWDLETLAALKSYHGHSDIVSCVSCHPTEPDLFLSCSEDGNLYMWDKRKPCPVTVLDTSPLGHCPSYATWQPGSQHIYAVADNTGQIVVKDHRVAIGTPLSFTPHTRLISKLEFSNDSPSLLASISEDCTTVVTSITSDSYKQIYRNTSHRDFVRGLSWSSNNKLFTCGWDSQVIAHSISEVSETSKSDSEPVVMEVNGDINTEQSDDKIKCNGTGTDVSESGDAKITT